MMNLSLRIVKIPLTDITMNKYKSQIHKSLTLETSTANHIRDL